MPASSADPPVYMPKAGELGSLIHWLHERGVSSPRIAAQFGTTAGNIRVIVNRSRNRKNYFIPLTAPIEKSHDGNEARTFGVHFQSHATERRKALDSVKEKLHSVVTTHRNRYQFAAAIGSLKQLLPLVGRPGNPSWIALQAELHYQLAWFHCHLGMSQTAVAESRAAMDLFRIAFHESGNKFYAIDYARAALPGSNAALLGRTPTTAFELLERASSAARYCDSPIGSEHHRQTGVAFFQLGQDDEAKREFLLASQSIQDLDQGATPTTLGMASSRHLYLVGSPNYEGAAELRNSVSLAFGQNSLEYSMATNWAAAAALATFDPGLRDEALKILEENKQRASHFGHQATITHLLQITPELDLYPKLQTSYLRRALYENTLGAY